MNIQSQRGFTLYELLITLLIVGIVLALGVPNLRDFTANSRISTAANELHSSFMLARSEAARSKTIVTIFASSDSLSDANCGGTFNQGWIIFTDLDGDLQRDGEDSVLRRHGPIDDNTDVNVNGDADYFSFAATGLGRGDVNGPSFQTAILCDDRGNVDAAGGSSAARYLVVIPIGRATVVRDKAIIQGAGGCP